MLKVRTEAYIRRIILFGMLYCFLLPACRRWHVKKSIKKAEHHAQFCAYAFSIEGIECKECVRAIVRDLRDSKLISYAEAICPKHDCSKTRITGYLEKQQEFPVQKIKQTIDRDHFTLTSITGLFSGMITQKNQTLFFKPHGADFELMLVVNAADFTQDIPVLKPSVNETSLFGSIRFDTNQFIVEREK
jgi:hypothetical protein